MLCCWLVSLCFFWVPLSVHPSASRARMWIFVRTLLLRVPLDFSGGFALPWLLEGSANRAQLWIFVQTLLLRITLVLFCWFCLDTKCGTKCAQLWTFVPTLLSRVSPWLFVVGFVLVRFWCGRQPRPAVDLRPHPPSASHSLLQVEQATPGLALQPTLGEGTRGRRPVLL